MYEAVFGELAALDVRVLLRSIPNLGGRWL